MIDAMTTTKKPAKKAPKPEGRKKSKLAQAGDEASRVARRTLLLTAVKACEWNLTRTAELLGLTTASDVIRALKELAPEEYAAARERGDVTTRRDMRD